MKKFIDTFHYLTQDLPDFSHLKQAEMACQHGAKGIQYRCLTKTDGALLREIHQIAAVCDDWGTTLIVTEHYHLLNQADIQGVHMENMDIDLSEIRKAIGPDKTLGASANTVQQILNHIENGADYIGCGPFGHTDTKPNACPHWQIEGYAAAVRQLSDLGKEIPLIAAGGVAISHIESLMQTGIFGVAISAAVNKAVNPAQAYKQAYQLLH